MHTRNNLESQNASHGREPSIDPLRASQVWVRRTLLCSDIVGYTGLLSRLGDRPALHVVRRHDAIVRSYAASHGGQVLELRGDSFLVGFGSPSDALACAVDVQRELAADRAAHPDGGVRVRIGVHTGEFLIERGRYFGLEVVVPFRLCDAAGADQILVSHPGDGATEASTAGARDFALHGIPRPVRAVEVDWQPAPAAPAPGVAPAPLRAVAGR